MVLGVPEEKVIVGQNEMWSFSAKPARDPGIPDRLEQEIPPGCCLLPLLV